MAVPAAGYLATMPSDVAACVAQLLVMQPKNNLDRYKKCGKKTSASKNTLRSLVAAIMFAKSSKNPVQTHLTRLKSCGY